MEAREAVDALADERFESGVVERGCAGAAHREAAFGAFEQDGVVGAFRPGRDKPLNEASLVASRLGCHVNLLRLARGRWAIVRPRLWLRITASADMRRRAEGESSK